MTMMVEQLIVEIHKYILQAGWFNEIKILKYLEELYPNNQLEIHLALNFWESENNE